MELKYSKQKQLGKRKTKKQSYPLLLNEYKKTNKIPEGMTKENTKKLWDYIDRECEVLWKDACIRTHGKALTGSTIDYKYYPNLDLKQPWQIHHLVGRGHHLTRWDINNGIVITSGVHYHLTNIDPNRFLAWLKESDPERYEWREKNLVKAYSYSKKPSIEGLLEIKNNLLS
jgi:hypothetical protein